MQATIQWSMWYRACPKGRWARCYVDVKTTHLDLRKVTLSRCAIITGSGWHKPKTMKMPCPTHITGWRCNPSRTLMSWSLWTVVWHERQPSRKMITKTEVVQPKYPLVWTVIKYLRCWRSRSWALKPSDFRLLGKLTLLFWLRGITACHWRFCAYIKGQRSRSCWTDRLS